MMSSGFPDRVSRYDVGMHQRRSGAAFVMKSSQVVVVAVDAPRRKNLESTLSVESSVSREINHAHSTAPKNAFAFVIVQHLPVQKQVIQLHFDVRRGFAFLAKENGVHGTGVSAHGRHSAARTSVVVGGENLVTGLAVQVRHSPTIHVDQCDRIGLGEQSQSLSVWLVL